MAAAHSHEAVLAPPLHVAILTETYLPEVGGGERQAELLARGLTNRGHRATIVTRRSRAELPYDDVRDGVRVVRIGPAGQGRWRKWGLAGTVLPALYGALSDIDVVFVSGYRIMGIPAVLASLMHRVPCVLKADSPGEMSGAFFRDGLATLRLQPTSLPVRALLAARNRLFRRADAFVAISQEIRAELLTCGVPPACIHHVPNAVEATRFQPANATDRAALRHRLALPGGPLVIYTGRLVSYKGLPLLLRVWTDIVRTDRTATLLLVGSGSGDMHNCEAELRHYVRTHGLDTRVLFVGSADNVEDYLRAADVFVFPTEREAFGVSLVEAMACGLPCITSCVGGIRDFLVHGMNGVEVPVHDANGWRCAIGRLLSDRERGAALGMAARHTVIERFSERVVVNQYADLFAALVSAAARR
jgi:glycosyltransferase involved in cell wall biosynthesis